MVKRGTLIAPLCVGLAALVLASPAGARTIAVTTTADEFGSSPGCALREAVQAANTDAAFGGCRGGNGPDTIALEEGEVYGRSLDGNGEDANMMGDLDVASRLEIRAVGGRATLNANAMDRVLHVLPGGNLSLSKLVITGASETYPSALVDGTGIFNGGELNVTRSRIVGNETLGNSSNNGGGIVNVGSARLDHSKVAGNTAGNVGGGISQYAGKLKIVDSTIEGNHADHVGGGIYAGGSTFDPDRVTIKGSTISGNSSGGDGGGLYVSLYGQNGDSDVARLTNTTVSGNQSDEDGGGVHQFVGEVKLNAVTVTRNIADADAGGSAGDGGGLDGSIAFRNSVVAKNRDLSAGNEVPDCGGGSQGHNVIGSAGDCFAAGSDVEVADPKLGPLANNGGSTKTHALRHGSAAIGRAGPGAPRKDQRGVRRDSDPDAGAFERR
jgi:CSLREA domain-containing protein